MNFEADDFDWALGELLALIWRGKLLGIPAHKLDPPLFHWAMSVIGMQLFVVREWAYRVFMGMEPFHFLGAQNEVARAE